MRIKALPAALSKEIPSSVVAGGLAGFTGGFHCKIVVTNSAQRCETHKIALFWWMASEDRLTGVSLWQLSCDPDGRVALRFRQYELSLLFCASVKDKSARLLIVFPQRMLGRVCRMLGTAYLRSGLLLRLSLSVLACRCLVVSMLNNECATTLSLPVCAGMDEDD